MDAPSRDGIEVPKWKCIQSTEKERASEMKITTIGIDLAKAVTALRLCGAAHGNVHDTISPFSIPANTPVS